MHVWSLLGEWGMSLSLKILIAFTLDTEPTGFVSCTVFAQFINNSS